MGGIAEGLGGMMAGTALDERRAQDAEFAALVDRQAGFVYRVAFGLLRHQQDAEDAVQEMFLKLYRTGGWRGMEDERAFLARTVWRVGLGRLGTAGAKAMRHAEDVTEMEIESSAATPEESALGGAERELMRRMVAALPEDLRQALVLSAVQGMRSQEVAAVLGIAEGTVRTRVMRAKVELRRRFLLASEPLRSQPLASGPRVEVKL